MSEFDTIRAWKGNRYRERLSESERAQLPDNPAGAIELAESILEDAVGGFRPLTLGMGCVIPLPPVLTLPYETYGCCQITMKVHCSV